MRRMLLGAGAALLICGPTVLAFFSGGSSTGLGSSRPSRPGPSSRSPPSRATRCRRRRPAAWRSPACCSCRLDRRLDDLGADRRARPGRPPAAPAVPGLLRRRAGAAAGPVAGGCSSRRWSWGRCVVVGYALSERLLPGLVELSRSRSSAGRLEQPLSYWNALGAVAAIGFVLAVRMAGDLERPRPARQRRRPRAWSRAWRLPQLLAWRARAAAAGLLVLLALAPAGRAQLRGVAIMVAAALAPLWPPVSPAITALELGEQGDAGDGLLMLGALVVLSLAAALIVPRAPRLDLPPCPRSGRFPAGCGAERDRGGGAGRGPLAVACSRASRRAPPPRPGPTPTGCARSTPTATATGTWRSRPGPTGRSPVSGPAGSGPLAGRARSRRRLRRGPLAVHRDRRRAGRGGAGLPPDAAGRNGGRGGEALPAATRRRPGWRPASRPGPSTPASTGIGRCPRSRCRRCCWPARPSRGRRNSPARGAPHTPRPPHRLRGSVRLRVHLLGIL